MTVWLRFAVGGGGGGSKSADRDDDEEDVDVEAEDGKEYKYGWWNDFGFARGTMSVTS